MVACESAFHSGKKPAVCVAAELPIADYSEKLSFRVDQVESFSEVWQNLCREEVGFG